MLGNVTFLKTWKNGKNASFAWPSKLKDSVKMLTVCTRVESLYKYSTKSKLNPIPLIVRGSYLSHFVKPRTSITVWYEFKQVVFKMHPFCSVPLHWKIYENVLGIMWNFATSRILPPVKSPLRCCIWYFCRKTVNLGLKRITQFRTKQLACLPKNKISTALSLKSYMFPMFITVFEEAFQIFFLYFSITPGKMILLLF